MDSLGLDILLLEMREDARLLEACASLARTRLESGLPGSLEACGFELNRAYNVLEKSFERICVAFENHFEKQGNYHDRLIERVSLDIPHLRPAFLPPTERAFVRELKGFRHVFRHAYDLQLRRDRLQELVAHAEEAARRFPEWLAAFDQATRPLL